MVKTVTIIFAIRLILYQFWSGTMWTTTLCNRNFKYYKIYNKLVMRCCIDCMYWIREYIPPGPPARYIYSISDVKRLFWFVWCMVESTLIWHIASEKRIQAKFTKRIELGLQFVRALNVIAHRVFFTLLKWNFKNTPACPKIDTNRSINTPSDPISHQWNHLYYQIKLWFSNSKFEQAFYENADETLLKEKTGV